jgi:C1A family cysteine protease
MNKTILLIASTALLIASGLYNAETANANTVPAPVQGLFAKWCMKHGKTYNSPDEHNFRLKTFFKNYLATKAESLTAVNYTVALNEFSDLTTEEFLTKHTGVTFETRKRTEQWVNPSFKADPPAEVNWVKAGKVTEIKNQGQCGSCWAFSVVAAVEAARAISGGPVQDLSEQQLVDCAQKYGPQGCNGGWMDDALRYVKDMGLETAQDYPYIAREQTCAYDASKVVTKISGIFDVAANNYGQLLSAAATSVITLALDAQGIMRYQSGVFDGTCGIQMNHAVNVVGYGTDAASGNGYWLMRNSWGSNWGESGYFRLIRDGRAGSGICGMRQRAYYPLM